MTVPTDPRFQVEVLRLLVQVAFANDEITKAESEAILGKARARGVPATEVQCLADALAGKAPPPAPDLGVLRLHREEVMTLAREFAALDEGGDADEGQLMSVLEELLGK